MPIHLSHEYADARTPIILAVCSPDKHKTSLLVSGQCQQTLAAIGSDKQHKQLLVFFLACLASQIPTLRRVSLRAKVH